MFFSLGLKSEELENRLIKIDCPACKKSGVAAQAIDQKQTFILFHFIPFLVYRPTIVKCECCMTELSANLKAKDLAQIGDPGFVARYLSLRKPIILTTLVFCGVIAWLIPVVGSIWTGIAYWWSRKFSGWIRKTALVLFILSFLPLLLLLIGEIFIALEDKPNQALLPTSTAVMPRAGHESRLP